MTRNHLIADPRYVRTCVAGVLSLLALSVAVAGARSGDGEQAVRVSVLDGTPNHVVLKYELGGFTQHDVMIDGVKHTQVALGKESLMKERGAPALPNVCRSVIIPDQAAMGVRVIASDHYDISDIDVAPSKGYILRTVNPEDVPYTFGPAYDAEAFYPGELASLREPYILRDHRAVVVIVNPFQYNPVSRTLRVYTKMVVEVVEVGPGKVNVLDSARGERELSLAFHTVYKHHFVNYNSGLRYDPLDETGDMLVICHDPWLSNIQPFVDHKNARGIDTTAVGVSTIPGGNNATSIKNYIQEVYDTSDLAFVLLVGDAAQVAPPYASGGASDPTYSKLAGDDDYPEIMVGRFSAESPADVDTQVERTIEYELMPAINQDWFWRGMGVASNQGPGDDGEYDNEHMDNIRDDLLAYGYTEVDQIYDPTATAAMVTNGLNAGRGIVNYTGHGGPTGWGSSGFSNSHVNALTNDNMLPFITSVACNTGEFDSYTCFGEAWLRATNGTEPTGAIGMYGSTISQSWDPPMDAQDEFVDMYVTETYAALGTLLYAGSCHMMDEYPPGHPEGSGVDMFDTWILFGDPSLRVVMKCADAGTIDLDKAKYACEDTAGIMVNDCGLNLDDDLIETVEVTVDSDSEPAGETVTLYETGSATAEFTGSIDLSTTDGLGVLLVGEGDTVTATYIDADDGEGGVDVVVTDVAAVDCTPPGISDVEVIEIHPRSAVITFDADEPVHATVYYGLSCGSLTGSASSSGYATSPTVALAGLDDSTAYFFAVEAEDEAGNTASDDNGGLCYSFTTPEGPSILLVDDDDNNPDVQSYYADAFDALGVEYDLYDTGNSDNEPDAATLGQYTTVVWFTGDEYGGACGPGSAGETALSSFLDAGGCLFINSQDYYYDRGMTSFMSNYLGAASITSDVSQTSVTGSGSLFTGFGPYSLSYPFYNYSDTTNPDGTAEVAFVGNAGNAALNKDTGVYRTIFWGFPFEAVPTAGDREALLSAVLDWCAPGGPWPPEAENGNAFTVEDIPVSITLVASDDGLPAPPVLVYIIASLPGNGSLSDPNGGAIDSVPYELLNNGNVVVYTPAADFSGSDNFPFKANDGGTAPGGGDSNIATILIDVAPDCNENEIADNQDMANCEGETWCDDCNTNGTLDECDIADGTSVDCDGNGIPDECVPPDCDDEDACTEDWCEPGTGCVHGPIDCDDEDECTYDWCDPATGCVYDYHARQYGDVYPLPHGDGAVEGFDILCVLDQANDVSRPDCMSGDIYPCDGGDEAVEGYDVLAVLDAADFAVENWCDDPCP